MSENQKFLNLIWGGGQQFSKMSEIQKSLKFPMGGLSLFGNFSQIFPTKWRGNEIPTKRPCELYIIYNPAAQM